MLVRQPQSLTRRIHVFHAGFTVRFARSFDFRNAFADDRVRHDHLRLPVIATLRFFQRTGERLHVVAVDLLHIEAVGLETFAGVFALRDRCHRIERDGVVVVNQDEVIEAEVAGEGARFRTHPFLQTTVTGETDHVLIENLVLLGVETRCRHFHRDGDADRIAHALTKRAGRALDSRCFEEFRVPGRFRMQLAETFELLHRQVVAAQVQPGVKKHRAVPSRENEVISIDPARLIRIVLERIAVKHGAHFRTTERKPEVS